MNNPVSITQPTQAEPLAPSHLLSELPINSHQLLFGLNFKYTLVDKKGLINRIKGNKQPMDIDLSCVLFDAALQVVDKVWFKQLRDVSQSIRHQGDSLNGKDRGDAAKLDHNVDVETIELTLEDLPATVHHLALIISSFNGYPLKSVERGNMYLSDDEGNEIISTDLTKLTTDANALCVATFSRELGEWRFIHHQLPLDHHKLPDMIEQLQGELARLYA